MMMTILFIYSFSIFFFLLGLFIWGRFFFLAPFPFRPIWRREFKTTPRQRITPPFCKLRNQQSITTPTFRSRVPSRAGCSNASHLAQCIPVPSSSPHPLNDEPKAKKIMCSDISSVSPSLAVRMEPASSELSHYFFPRRIGSQPLDSTVLRPPCRTDGDF